LCKSLYFRQQAAGGRRQAMPLRPSWKLEVITAAYRLLPTAYFFIVIATGSQLMILRSS